jgi:hypothetical protein
LNETEATSGSLHCGPDNPVRAPFVFDVPQIINIKAFGSAADNGRAMVRLVSFLFFDTQGGLLWPQVFAAGAWT